MSGELQHILGNASIIPDTANAWDTEKTYPKNTWVYHDNANWTARRDTLAGEKPGNSAAWLPGPAGPWLGAHNWMLAADVASFEDEQIKWTNNGDNTGVLTAKADLLLRVWCQGGGGGGGGAYKSNAFVTGGSGGSGECTMKHVYVHTGQSIACTIGKGGAGGIGKIVTANEPASGTVGGTTSFGVLLSAYGGGSGAGYNNPTTSETIFITPSPISTPRTPNALSIAQRGEHCAIRYINLTTGLLASVAAGAGGNSVFGRGGDYEYCDTTKTVGMGKNATGYGGGGGGSCAYKVPCNGGKGGDGCIYIERIA